MSVVATVFTASFRDVVVEELSGAIAKDYASEICRFHRIQASPGFHRAVAYVKGVLEGLPGLSVRVEEFVADGRTRRGLWTAPLGWQVRDGELSLVKPRREVLVRFDETPTCVVAHSQRADVEAQLVYVGEGTRDKDYRGLKVEGRIVLATGRAWEVHRQAVLRRGALGVIHYPPFERRAGRPDLVPYEGIWPRVEEAARVGFAFSVSGRVGEMLRRLVAQEREVVVHARVEAELFVGRQQVLTATISGSEYPHEEVLLIAHLCHPRPGANDNASGSALLMEMARTISTLIEEARLPRPLRTIRFLWVPEFYGTIAYLQAHPELAYHALSGINCDMVGENPALCGGVLILHRTPDSLPSYINDLLEHLLEEAASDSRLISLGGGRRPFHFRVEGFHWGSDHLMLVDASVGVPCPMLNHWPDAFYHSSEDAPDKIDPTQLRRVGYAALMATLIQAYAEPADAMFIASEVHARAQHRLAQATQQIIRRAVRLAKEPGQGPAVARCLRRGMHILRWVVRREVAALKSVLLLAQRDTHLSNFIAGLCDSMERARQAEVKKLRQIEDLLCTSIGYNPPRKLTLLKRERETMQIIPLRQFRWPLSFRELLRMAPPKEAEWLRQQRDKRRHFVELAIELTNFADGHLTLHDILLALEAEFGEEADVDTVNHLTRLLEELELLELRRGDKTEINQRKVTLRNEPFPGVEPPAPAGGGP